MKGTVSAGFSTGPGEMAIKKMAFWQIKIKRYLSLIKPGFENTNITLLNSAGMKVFLILLLFSLFFSPNNASPQESFYTQLGHSYRLTEEGASYLSSLPLKCLEKEFPYKTGIVFLDSAFIAPPKDYHPAFYGCYDWHSSVHGHWMLVKLLKQFPQLPEGEEIRDKLRCHLRAENIQKELSIFRADNLSFERIYGWGWLLYLQKELLSWDDPWAKNLSQNLQPLAQFFSAAWITFLKKIAYPIRVGEHTNLAFGLSFAWDYAMSAADTALQKAVKDASFRFYLQDKACPATWEPGGYDFLSPCLEEARLMSRLMNKQEYTRWLKGFMPGLMSNPRTLFKIAIVRDRTDGKLIHLDGLNFSRAWCLYEIAKRIPDQYANPIRQLASRHLEAALPHIVSGNYAGEHWLASFAVYALSKN